MSERTIRSILGTPTTFSQGSNSAGFQATCWDYSADPGARITIDRYRICFAHGKVDWKHHY